MTLQNPPIELSAAPLGVGQLFERGWNSIKDQVALVAGLSLVAFMGMFVAGSLPVVGWAMNAVISVGYLSCLLRLRRGQEFDFADFFWAFQNMNRLLHVVLAAVLVFMAVVMGTIFFLIPGIWIWVALSLTTVIQVKEDQDAITSIKASYNLVQGDWWNVFGMMLFIVGLNILGALCFLVGLLVTLPLSYLMIIEKTEDLARRKGGLLAASGSGPSSATAPPGSSSFQVNPS